MSTYSYYPSRPAPTPPSWPRQCDDLPADHPFLNPYTPPQQVCRTSSCSSLDSAYSFQTPSDTPPHDPQTPKACIRSSATGNYPSSLSRNPHSPSSWLAAPLTPPRPTLGHTHISRPRPAYPSNSSPAPTCPAFIPLPTELSLFDCRPKNLLADLEFIAGKKLHFPFLQRRRGSKKDVRVKIENDKRPVSVKCEMTKSPLWLVKEKRMNEEQEYLYEAAMMREQMARQASQRERGFREGNWI